jgi:tRNA threonylcarbamoyladenosine biosynthesis protein TsaE
LKTDIQEIVSNSEDETINLGIRIAKRIIDDAMIPLVGPLGVGKSVLARGIARGMGYFGRLRSPSFTIERIYNTPRGELHHWDLYRLEGTAEIEPQFELIRSQGGIRVIEWGERLDKFLTDNFPVIEMRFHDRDNSRLIRIDRRIVEIE